MSAHLHDVPPDGGLGDWYSDATAEVAEHEDFERRVIHHVEEHLATYRHVALSHTHPLRYHHALALALKT